MLGLQSLFAWNHGCCVLDRRRRGVLDVRHPAVCCTLGSAVQGVRQRPSPVYEACCTGYSTACCAGSATACVAGCAAACCAGCATAFCAAARLTKRFASICSAKPHKVEHACRVERARQQCNTTALPADLQPNQIQLNL